MGQQAFVDRLLERVIALLQKIQLLLRVGDHQRAPAARPGLGGGGAIFAQPDHIHADRVGLLLGEAEEVFPVERFEDVHLLIPGGDQVAIGLIELQVVFVQPDIGNLVPAGTAAPVDHERVQVVGARLRTEGVVADVERARIALGQRFGHAGGVGPGVEHFVEQRPLGIAGGRSTVLGEQPGEAAGLGGRFAQVAHIARTHHVRQRLRGVAYGDGVAKLAIEIAAGQVQVADRAGRIVGTGKGGLGGHLIAASQSLIERRIVQADGGDARIGQAHQLARVRHAVLIQIAPHLHIGKLRIVGIEHAIGVAVQIAQGIETVAGFRVVRLHIVDAEQLRPRIDAAVAVLVQHQQTVVALHPARATACAVAVVIEKHGAVGADGFDAVTVEVEGEGVARPFEVFRIREKVRNCICYLFPPLVHHRTNHISKKYSAADHKSSSNSDNCHQRRSYYAKKRTNCGSHRYACAGNLCAEGRRCSNACRSGSKCLPVARCYRRIKIRNICISIVSNAKRASALCHRRG